MIFCGPPGCGQDDARAGDRRRDRRAPRAALGGELGHRRRARRHPGRARGARPSARRTRPLHRRDPPLQQGPAGRAAAGHRGRRRHADRRDHREPVLRGQLGAAVALPALPLRAARRRRSSSRSCGARSTTRERGLGGKGVDARRRRARRSSPRSRAATRAWRSTRSRPPCARAPPAAPGAARSTLTVDDLQDAAQKKPVSYDREDAHYDTISAFIKSMRGSDPDAAMYYLAAMLAGGEDPKFIARRMIIFASEDVGNADPRALAGRRGGGARRGVRRPARVPHQPEPGGARTWRSRPRATPPTRRSTPPWPTSSGEGNEPPPPHLRDANYRGAKEPGPRRGLQVPARLRRLGRAAVPARRAARRHLFHGAARRRARAGPAARRAQAPRRIGPTHATARAAPDAA